MTYTQSEKISIDITSVGLAPACPNYCITGIREDSLVPRPHPFLGYETSSLFLILASMS